MMFYIYKSFKTFHHKFTKLYFTHVLRMEKIILKKALNSDIIGKKRIIFDFTIVYLYYNL